MEDASKNEDEWIREGEQGQDLHFIPSFLLLSFSGFLLFYSLLLSPLPLHKQAFRIDCCMMHLLYHLMEQADERVIRA